MTQVRDATSTVWKAKPTPTKKRVAIDEDPRALQS
jgi:hypothetical protein